MINRIDVSSVLGSCGPFTNLLTRPTGAAVRSQIEQQLTDLRESVVTVIDFSQVELLDFSCADEVIAKLLLRFGSEPARETYFVFRGVTAHLDAIETVLERHMLALVIQLDDGAAHLIGAVPEAERRLWEALRRIGGGVASAVAAEIGANEHDTVEMLDGLSRRRLVMHLGDRYVAVGGAV
jgi:hypothetical protein